MKIITAHTIKYDLTAGWAGNRAVLSVDSLQTVIGRQGWVFAMSKIMFKRTRSLSSASL